MGFKLGRFFKLYLLTTGTRAAWPATGDPNNLGEITNVRSLERGGDVSEADVTTRASNGYQQVVASLKQASLSWEMVYDTEDTHLIAIQAAWDGSTLVALAALDGVSDVEGTRGIWADWMVTRFQISEPIDGAAMVSVEVKVGYSAVAPELVEVAEA